MADFRTNSRIREAADAAALGRLHLLGWPTRHRGWFTHLPCPQAPGRALTNKWDGVPKGSASRRNRTLQRYRYRKLRRAPRDNGRVSSRLEKGIGRLCPPART